MKYYLEIDEINIIDDKENNRLLSVLKNRNYCEVAPLIDFLCGAEDCFWGDHEFDLCRLSKSFPNHEFLLTIVDEEVSTKCYIDGYKVGEFDSGILKSFGKLRFHNDEWYAIPEFLLEKFDQNKKHDLLEAFKQFIVDPFEVKVVCPEND